MPEESIDTRVPRDQICSTDTGLEGRLRCSRVYFFRKQGDFQEKQGGD